MPTVVFHKNGQSYRDEVNENTNLVVRAGIKQFPYPHLVYGCGMGKCAKCACRVIGGGDRLPPPNWKETKLLGERIGQGYRLMCQLWLHHDIEIIQDGAQAAARPGAVAAAAGGAASGPAVAGEQSGGTRCT
jgi:ferredoxin